MLRVVVDILYRRQGTFDFFCLSLVLFLSMNDDDKKYIKISELCGERQPAAGNS